MCLSCDYLSVCSLPCFDGSGGSQPAASFSCPLKGEKDTYLSSGGSPLTPPLQPPGGYVVVGMKREA